MIPDSCSRQLTTIRRKKSKATPGQWLSMVWVTVGYFRHVGNSRLQQLTQNFLESVIYDSIIWFQSGIFDSTDTPDQWHFFFNPSRQAFESPNLDFLCQLYKIYAVRPATGTSGTSKGELSGNRRRRPRAKNSCVAGLGDIWNVVHIRTQVWGLNLQTLIFSKFSRNKPTY